MHRQQFGDWRSLGVLGVPVPALAWHQAIPTQRSKGSGKWAQAPALRTPDHPFLIKGPTWTLRVNPPLAQVTDFALILLGAGNCQHHYWVMAASDNAGRVPYHAGTIEVHRDF